MTLTAKQVEHMKPGGKRQEIAAGPPNGLYLVIQPSGAKSWALRYRFHGRSRKLTLDKGYPEWSLAAARAEANAALEKLKEGVDPAGLAAEAETPSGILKEIASEWIKRQVSQTRTAGETARILEREVLSRWRNRPIDDVGRADILKALDEIMDRGAGVMANRTLNVLRRFFSWAIERGYLEASPVAGIRPPGKEQTRDRVLTDGELAEIWKATGFIGYPHEPFYRLLILTGQRRAEVAGLRWEDLDLEGAVWILPKELTKAGRQHFAFAGGHRAAAPGSPLQRALCHEHDQRRKAHQRFLEIQAAAR
jgi:hypothetical protein